MYLQITKGKCIRHLRPENLEVWYSQSHFSTEILAFSINVCRMNEKNLYTSWKDYLKLVLVVHTDKLTRLSLNDHYKFWIVLGLQKWVFQASLGYILKSCLTKKLFSQATSQTPLTQPISMSGHLCTQVVSKYSSLRHVHFYNKTLK